MKYYDEGELERAQKEDNLLETLQLFLIWRVKTSLLPRPVTWPAVGRRRSADPAHEVQTPQLPLLHRQPPRVGVRRWTRVHGTEIGGTFRWIVFPATKCVDSRLKNIVIFWVVLNLCIPPLTCVIGIVQCFELIVSIGHPLEYHGVQIVRIRLMTDSVDDGVSDP